MNRALEKVLDATLSKAVRFIKRTSHYSPSVVERVIEMSRDDSARFVLETMPSAMSFHRKHDGLLFAFAKRPKTGLILEFGVWKGESINLIAGQCDETVFGFDSFEGLQEDWGGTSMQRAHFSLGGVAPQVRPNVNLVVGWFDRTLPGFLAQRGDAVAFVHIDSDTYEAAKLVLQSLRERIQVGAVLVFDEYLGFPGWRGGEHRALTEFLTESGIQVEYLFYTGSSVGVRVTSTGVVSHV